ncbi:MAG TPA: preprotein translocase subunit SecG [Gammaproteobacteria bacterium]|jgi:preprotein translocase subunit SecG|nr:preprotein translocase subunit SecG [Gammaproteobacteria bacterium]
MLYGILLIIDVLLAIGIIALVLLQHGKGADAGAAFGSGASATVFGARGSASFLSRTTAVFATLFFINSVGLAFIVSHQPADRSVTEQLMNKPAADVPLNNAPAAPSEARGKKPSVQPEDVPQ